MEDHNILLHPFRTPLESVPFEDIRQEQFEPAIMELINTAKAETDAIVQDPQTPSFANTIEALEKAGHRLQLVSEIFFNLNSAETNDYLEEAARRISPELAAYGNDIMLNKGLFERVRYVHEHTDRSALTGEQQRLLDKTYKSFVRNGALLDEAAQERLRSIDRELATLGVRFSQNVLAETNGYILHLTREKDLGGLPDPVIAAARAAAEKRGKEGWVFTLQFPSITPFLKYSTNRELRAEIHRASGSRALHDNEYNNEQIIKDIVALRKERARLLGFEHHADFVLQERMAGNTPAVLAFLQDLLQKARPFADREIAQLATLAAKDGIDTLMAYDHAYYAEKVKEQLFDYSEEALKPYFSLQNVLQAAFQAAERLYGLTFRLRDDIQKYHPEVSVYEVMEDGRHKALLYTDFFPREGKRPGAWMTAYRGQHKDITGDHRPHISIVCNFSRPVGNIPSLLTFTEVTTLFHEFGHALHGILADTQYETLSGTNVYWDFVELPSQFMENYCYEKSFLREFARHYETHEPLSDAFIDKIVASANFMQGYQTVRQLGFGMLDMQYHTDARIDAPVEIFEKDTIRQTLLYPDIPGTAISPSFSHIFAGGYAAGYYSYKWAEVLDADAFEYFRENGIFDPETAAKFKTLLSSGGTADPMQLYMDFRGRKPDTAALLRRAGLE